MLYIDVKNVNHNIYPYVIRRANQNLNSSKKEEHMKRSNQLFKKATQAITLMIMLGLTVSCQRQAANAQSEEKMEALVLRILEIWNKGNLALIEELYAPNYVAHLVGDANGDYEGYEAFRGFVNYIRTGYPDSNVKFDEMIVKGDKVVSRYTFTGTNTGPRGEVPPTGKKIQFSGVLISHIVNGKIAEDWNYRNVAAILTQLGYTITPPPTISEK